MKLRAILLLQLLVIVAASAGVAQPQSVPGLIAKQETALLSHEDKQAAYDAEQAVLASDWGTQGYNWKGPNGAYGTIISSGAIPQADSKTYCRRFIHIVHHANDGGLNPTFQGYICRAYFDGEWRVK